MENWTNEKQYEHQCWRVSRAELSVHKLMETHKKAFKDGCYTKIMHYQLIAEVLELYREKGHLDTILKRLS